MAKSEKAKALEAQQKAAVKAEKLRKKNSDDPADWGRVRQYVHLYKNTAEIDPKLNLYLALAVLGSVALVVALGVLLNTWPILTAITAVLTAALAANLVLLRRAKQGALTRHAGQAGSASVALQMLNSKKYTHQAAIAFTRELDMVHRVVGPCGVVLVGEGQPVRVKPLLAKEQRRHEQVLFGIPVTTMMLGDGAGQVKLKELQKAVEKLPKSIQPSQQASIQQKLRSLEAMRPKAPLPKGPLPQAKGMNRAMRGR